MELLVNQQQDQREALHNICLENQVPKDIEFEIRSFVEPIEKLEDVLVRQIMKEGDWEAMPSKATDIICEYLFSTELEKLRPMDVFAMYSDN